MFRVIVTDIGLEVTPWSFDDRATAQQFIEKLRANYVRFANAVEGVDFTIEKDGWE